MVARADRYRKVGLFNGIFAPAVNLRAGRQVPRAGSFVVVRAAAGDAVNCHTSIGAGVVRGLEGAAAAGRGAQGKSLLSWPRGAFFAGRSICGVACSGGAAGELQRSLRQAQGKLFVGSPRRSRGLRFLRMTRG